MAHDLKAPKRDKIEVGFSDKRGSVLRRQLSDLVMRNGEVEESKVWANVGKFLCCYLILAYTDKVMDTEYTLLTLLSLVIAPELVKKFLTLKMGGSAK